MKPIKLMRYRSTPGGGGGLDFASEIAADLPFLWWRLGESSGTTIADASGNGRVGLLAGTPGTDYDLSVPGLVGDSNKAVKFNTNNGYVRSNSTYVFPLTNFTHMIAFKSDASAAAGTVTQLNQNDSPASATGGRDRGFILGSDGKMYFSFWNGSTTVAISTSAAVNDGTPHLMHIAVGSSTTEMYLDGVSQGSTPNVPGYTAPTYFYVAATNKSDAPAPANPSGGFRGVLDEAAVFQNRLSALRIAAHARAAGY